MIADIIVEDGSGVTGANSYISYDTFNTYCTTRGHDISSYTESQLSGAIIKGADYLDRAWFWPGYRTSSSQAMQWPRTGAYYRDGYYIESTEIPTGLACAQSEYAFASLSESLYPGSDTSNIKSISESVSSLKTSTTYFENVSADPIFTHGDNCVKNIRGVTKVNGPKITSGVLWALKEG